MSDSSDAYSANRRLALRHDPALAQSRWVRTSPSTWGVKPAAPVSLEQLAEQVERRREEDNAVLAEAIIARINDTFSREMR